VLFPRNKDERQICYAYLQNSLHLLRRNAVPVLSANLLAACVTEYNAVVYKLTVYCARSTQYQWPLLTECYSLTCFLFICQAPNPHLNCPTLHAATSPLTVLFFFLPSSGIQWQSISFRFIQLSSFCVFRLLSSESFSKQSYTCSLSLLLAVLIDWLNFVYLVELKEARLHPYVSISYCTQHYHCVLVNFWGGNNITGTWFSNLLL
jgi:hypothetical protein